MKKIAVIAFLISAALAGCHHKKADTTGGNNMAGSGSDMGSAAGSGGGSAAGSGSAM